MVLLQRLLVDLENEYAKKHKDFNEQLDEAAAELKKVDSERQTTSVKLQEADADRTDLRVNQIIVRRLC